MKRSKIIWIYLILEKNIRYAYSFIQNRNDCDELYQNGFFGFFSMLYLETHNSLTAKLFEGFIYEDYTVWYIIKISIQETYQY